MHDELKDQLDAAKYRVKVKQTAVEKLEVESWPYTDEHGNEYEDDSWLTDEMLEAHRIKGDNER